MFCYSTKPVDESPYDESDLLNGRLPFNKQRYEDTDEYNFDPFEFKNPLRTVLRANRVLNCYSRPMYLMNRELKFKLEQEHTWEVLVKEKVAVVAILCDADDDKESASNICDIFFAHHEHRTIKFSELQLEIGMEVGDLYFKGVRRSRVTISNELRWPDKEIMFVIGCMPPGDNPLKKAIYLRDFVYTVRCTAKEQYKQIALDADTEKLALSLMTRILFRNESSNSCLSAAFFYVYLGQQMIQESQAINSEIILNYIRRQDHCEFLPSIITEKFQYLMETAVRSSYYVVTRKMIATPEVRFFVKYGGPFSFNTPFANEPYFSFGFLLYVVATIGEWLSLTEENSLPSPQDN